MRHHNFGLLSLAALSMIGGAAPVVAAPDRPGASPRPQGAGKGGGGKREHPARSYRGFLADQAEHALLSERAAAKRQRRGERLARIVAAGGAIALRQEA